MFIALPGESARLAKRGLVVANPIMPFDSSCSGNLGTLTEIVLTWNLSFVRGFSNKPRMPLFCSRQPWEKALLGMKEVVGISDADMSLVRFFDNDKPEELLEEIAKLNLTHTSVPVVEAG